LPLLSPNDANGLIPYPWDLVAVENGGHSLLVVVHASPAVIKGAGVTETPDEIRLTIYGEKPPAGPVMSVAIHSIFLIQLPKSVGSRRVSNS
jgi:hypothetical protein